MSAVPIPGQQRCGRICASFLVLATFAATPVSADQCGEPNFPPPETALIGEQPDYSFSDMSAVFPGSCAPQIQVYKSYNGNDGDYGISFAGPLTIVKFYPCTGDKVTLAVFAPNMDSTSDVDGVLADICGPDWVQQYYPFINSDDAKAASTFIPSGQGSQTIVLADFNGDGNPDAAIVFGKGILVELLAADGSVLSSNEYPIGFAITNQLASDIIAADFNGDGKPDLAISNIGSPGTDSGGMAILLGNGDGTFGAPAAVSAGLNPLSLVAADFNGDGKLDIAAANQSSGAAGGYGPGTVSILLGKGDGTFAAPVSYTIGENKLGFPDSIIALDLNGDGLPDLAVANRNDSSISTLINSGGGKFKAPSITSLPVDTQYLAYADFNHDNKLDLVAASEVSGALVMLLGKGDGTFQPPAAYATGTQPGSIGVLPLQDKNTLLITADSITGSEWITVVSPQGAIGAPALNFIGGKPTGVAAADLNGDGQPDAVVTGASSDVVVTLSKNGQFAAPVGYSLGSPSPQAVAIGDLNNDGKPDIITANEDASVSVLLGNGDGTFQPATSTPVSENAEGLALGDFNGAGHLGVAVASYGSDSGGPGSVTVLPGSGDGTFQTPVILSVNSLHAEAVAAADLNGDGIVDLAVVGVGTSGQPATLAVFLGQPGGTFQTARTFQLLTIGGNESGIAISDFNGDGKPDIAAFSDYGTQIDVLLGDGAGNFHEAPHPPTSVVADNPALALADVNGDGKLDLVTAGSYLLGNGDGTFQSEQEFLAAAFPTSVAPTKFGANPTLISVGQASTMVATSFVLPSASALTVAANVSAASSTVTTLAPASIATAYGSNLATGTAAEKTSTLPTNLEGTTVTIKDSSGVQHVAPLFYVSPTQVNYEVPAGTAIGTAQVSIAAGNGLQGSANVQIANIAPGVFTLTPAGLVAADVLVVAANGSRSFQNVYQLGNANTVVPLPINVSAGQVYLEIFGTGIRNAKSVTATIGGHSVPVLSAGSQGVFIGLDQVNIGPLPSSLKGSGPTNIALTADGEAANTVNVTFQ